MRREMAESWMFICFPLFLALSLPRKSVEKSVGVKGQLEIFNLNYRFTKIRKQNQMVYLAGGGLGPLFTLELVGSICLSNWFGGGRRQSHQQLACPFVPKSGFVDSGRACALSKHDSCQPLSCEIRMDYTERSFVGQLSFYILEKPFQHMCVAPLKVSGKLWFWYRSL